LIVTKFVGTVPDNATQASKSGPKPRGSIKLNGVAQERGIWAQLEQRLKDLEHHVTSPPPNRADQHSDLKFSKYPWPFSADVRINMPEKQPVGKAAPKAQPAPTKPTTPAAKQTDPASAPETPSTKSAENKSEDKST
jgi:hypothetical protein